MQQSNFDDYESPAVTVDVLVFTIKDNKLCIFLVKRGFEPYKGEWAVPGVFLKVGESLEAAAKRGLTEKTGVKDLYLEQLYTFGDLDRDPRARVVTVAYFALTTNNQLPEIRNESVQEIALFPVNELPQLAFDHKKIVQYAIDRLRNKIEYTNIVYGLLSEQFTLTDLQRVYEIVLNKQLDKRNFRKRILSLDILEPVDKKAGGAHRPAMLYQFKKREPIILD